MNLDFLKDDEEKVEDSALKRLSSLTDAYRTLESNIAAIEAELKAQKEAFNQISQVEIPNLVNQYGLSELRINDKTKIIIKQDVSVSVPEVTRGDFFRFLEDRGESDIIKLMISLPRMPDEKMNQLLEFLTNYEYEFDAEQNVHPMTLKKYFKELLGIGAEDQESGIARGKYLRIQDIEEFAKVYVYWTTKLK